jgi:hypothetical protein
MNISGVKEKITEAIEKIKVILNNIHNYIDRLLARIPDEKRRPFLIGLGGIGGFFLILLILILSISPGKKTKVSPAIAAPAIVIPHEELFLPAEPNFVPEFLLEREPRRFWSMEDIRPYWKAPEISEHWKDEVKSAVDQLMEGVP